MTTKPTYRDYGIYLRREMRQLVKEYGWVLYRFNGKRERPLVCGRHTATLTEPDDGGACRKTYTCPDCFNEAAAAQLLLKNEWDAAQPRTAWVHSDEVRAKYLRRPAHGPMDQTKTIVGGWQDIGGRCPTPQEIGKWES